MFSESADLYDVIYRTFKDYRQEAREVAARIRAMVPEAVDVLDVACGTGEHAKYLIGDHGFRVDGVDLEPKFIAQAARKNVSGDFSAANMVDLQLERTYDVVLCLFSSIGYVESVDRLRTAIARFAAHTRPRGIVLVEPWFEPGQIQDGYTTVRAAENAEVKVARVTRNEVRDRRSTLHFEYLVADRGGIRHLIERHELTLFTRQEMVAAFEEARLSVEYDDHGITGRGLYVGRQTA